MREVGALAGVSIKTVSRVVNREPGVSPEVKARVEKAVRQLGYRHNLAASNLRRANARSAMVGALVQDVSNSFSAALLRSLEDAAHSRDMLLFAASLDEEPDREHTLVESLVRRRVDGLLLMPATQRQDYLVDDVRAGLPVVFVDRRPQGLDADSVTVDNAGGARMAVEHLLAHGHERIAVLADLPDIQTGAARLAGYWAALQAAGLPVRPEHVVTSLRSEDVATEATLRLLDSEQPPTAIFAARNALAVGAIRALRQRGATGSVALVGFDDFPLADLVDPPLTVIRQNVAQIGAEVTRILFSRIDGDHSVPEHLVLPPTLVQRGSGEIRP
ncbi:LacI family DNA-binding transcriptional regulator [Angustibacter peucedani]